MKRCWFGLILLLVLLLGCAWSSGYMSKVHSPVSETAMEAADFALEGDWGNAMTLAGRIRTQWENRWGIVAAFADHEPMEEIDGLFAQLEIYSRAGDNLSTAAVCAELSQRLEAMGDAHKGSWWNLL